MSRWFGLVSILVLAVSVFTSGPAGAHPALKIAADAVAVALPTEAARPAATPESAAAWSAAPTLPSIPWPAMLAAAILLALAWRRPRRALALAIVLILGLLAFENGVHSVHHLGDLRSEATCSVAVATAHLAGTPVDGATQVHLVLMSPEHFVPQQPLSFESSYLVAHQGRAPPISA